jgi:hypothetical protein
MMTAGLRALVTAGTKREIEESVAQDWNTPPQKNPHLSKDSHLQLHLCPGVGLQTNARTENHIEDCAQTWTQPFPSPPPPTHRRVPRCWT